MHQIMTLRMTGNKTVTEFNDKAETVTLAVTS